MEPSVDDVALRMAAAVRPLLLAVNLFEDVELQAFGARRPVFVEEKLLLLVVALVLVIVIDRPVRLRGVSLPRFLHVWHVHALPLGEAVDDYRVPIQLYSSSSTGDADAPATFGLIRGALKLRRW